MRRLVPDALARPPTFPHTTADGASGAAKRAHPRQLACPRNPFTMRPAAERGCHCPPVMVQGARKHTNAPITVHAGRYLAALRTGCLECGTLWISVGISGRTEDNRGCSSAN